MTLLILTFLPLLKVSMLPVLPYLPPLPFSIPPKSSCNSANKLSLSQNNKTTDNNCNSNCFYSFQIGIFSEDGVDDLGERQYAPQNTNAKGPDLTALFTITKTNQPQVCSNNVAFIRVVSTSELLEVAQQKGTASMS